jgi:hypothetical protein
VLALREYLCGTQSDTSRYEVQTKSKYVYMLVVLRDLSNCYQKFLWTIIDYGEYSATCSDIYESFADGKCLDNVFMQCFIQCVDDDAKNQQTSMSSNRLILDVNVGVNYRNIHTPYSYTHWMNPSILTPFILFIVVTTQL